MTSRPGRELAAISTTSASTVRGRGQIGRFDARYGCFVDGLRSDPGSSRGFAHGLAPFQQKSGSFEGGKTIAIVLFSRETHFSTTGARPPFLGKRIPAWKIRCFCIFAYPPPTIATHFCPDFQGFAMVGPNHSMLTFARLRPCVDFAAALTAFPPRNPRIRLRALSDRICGSSPCADPLR